MNVLNVMNELAQSLEPIGVRVINGVPQAKVDTPAIFLVPESVDYTQGHGFGPGKMTANVYIVVAQNEIDVQRLYAMVGSDSERSVFVQLRSNAYEHISDIQPQAATDFGTYGEGTIGCKIQLTIIVKGT